VTFRPDLVDPLLFSQLQPSRDLELLRHTQSDLELPFERQIFANRTLRFEKIRYVGFDLDWTLADYSRDHMSRLAFELTLNRLVEKFGYPEQVLQAEFRADFCRRGLILDTEAGMVVKMNRHRYVGRAYHGRRFLDAAERAELYRREPINPANNRFYHVDTLFELPEVNIFSEVIEMHLNDPQAVPLESYVKLFQDTRHAIDSIHADGSLKSRILADLESYLPRDPQLPLALERLSLDGKKLMLITNSEWYYTDGLCRHLFEGLVQGVKSWREVFDLIVVSAGKPGFFRKARPFVRLEEGKPMEEVDVPQWGGIYAGGSREGLMQLIGGYGEQVLYVGDHIYGDILSSKLTSTWRTALVVEELEEELRSRRQLDSQYRHIGVLRAEIAELGLQMDDLNDIMALYRRLAGNDDDLAAQKFPAFTKALATLAELRGEHKAMRQHAERLQNRISKAINPYWGSVFKQGSNKSLFGSQVDDFACIYTSKVRNFAHYGSRHYFRVASDPMMHEVEL
jgi:5'-nucleotidase